MTIIDVMRDLFSRWFGPTFSNWRVFLKALHALPMDDAELEIYRHHTGRTDPPTKQAKEAWVIAGRRGGKSLIAALLAVYAALFRDYREHLVPGERATVMVLAADKRQAKIIYRYARGFLRFVPMLNREIVRETQDEIELNNGNVIEVHVSNHRSVRGYTAALVIADEVAHWQTDSDAARSDVETINAIRPTLASIPGSMLIGISTPYARKGVLWERYSRYWGQDGDVLVWRATTREMNATIDQAEIDRALEEDESAARAEYLAEFRTDIESFIGREAVQAVTIPDRWEMPPSDAHGYFAFTDPAGGGGRDSMTLAIAHQEGETAILDLVREVRPPFSPEAAVESFVEVLRRYRCNSVTGDRYAGTWPEERFRVHGVTYETSSLNRSEIYLALLPMVTAGRVELLDHSRLLKQLRSLERRTSRIGRDSVDHPRHSHDDVINAAAGALVGVKENVGPGLTQHELLGV